MLQLISGALPSFSLAGMGWWCKNSYQKEAEKKHEIDLRKIELNRKEIKSAKLDRLQNAEAINKNSIQLELLIKQFIEKK